MKCGCKPIQCADVCMKCCTAAHLHYCRDNDRRRYNDLFLGFVTRAELSLTLKVPRDESVEDAYGVCLNISAPAGFRYSSHTGFDVCSSSTTIICCVSAPIANGDSVSDMADSFRGKQVGLHVEVGTW